MILTKEHIGKRVRRGKKGFYDAVEGVVLETDEFGVNIKSDNGKIDVYNANPSHSGTGEWELVNPPKPKRKASISTKRCARILCQRLRMSYGSWHGLNELESFELLNLLGKVR